MLRGYDRFTAAVSIHQRHDHGKNFSGKDRIKLRAKSLISQVYDLLARHRVDSTSFGASALPQWRQPKFPKHYSTPGPDMPEHTFRSATKSCCGSVSGAWNGPRRSEWVSTFPLGQLDNLDNSSSSEKRVKSFKIWWTRGDSNPRPPRCERGKSQAKTRCCNHLAFATGSLVGLRGLQSQIVGVAGESLFRVTTGHVTLLRSAFVMAIAVFLD